MTDTKLAVKWIFVASIGTFLFYFFYFLYFAFILHAGSCIAYYPPSPCPFIDSLGSSMQSFAEGLGYAIAFSLGAIFWIPIGVSWAIGFLWEKGRRIAGVALLLGHILLLHVFDLGAMVTYSFLQVVGIIGLGLLWNKIKLWRNTP
ncbi:MAG: hypothetical protein HYT41_00995 [Candidatus Sungbacteria bacterium]|nr:hypothetical protein [Candidatus Sungbacteria bacterium]